MGTTVNEAERDTVIRDLIDWIVDGGRTSANAKETAIGPPVNFAARLLSAAATLGCDRVMSADLAKLVQTECVAAGEAALKGFDGKHVIWKF